MSKTLSARSPSPSPSGMSPLRPPSARTIWISDNWPPILGITVLTHLAHYQHLNRVRKPNPNQLKDARFWAIAGGGWMVTYLSIVTLVAVAQARVNHYRDPATRGLYRDSLRTMSADFWAGYISGAVGIMIGNPLDLLKVRLQARDALPSSSFSSASPASVAASLLRQFESPASLVTGSAAPIAGYGALNALLFVSYNRTEAALNSALDLKSNLWTTWFAGAVGGLATWVVSTPTELIKCRAQLSSPPASSWAIAKDVWRAEGIRGLYFGGVVTALRDSIGYGFYFWSYELSTRWMGVATTADAGTETNLREEAAKVLLCGGLAGVVTWASIFPLDVIKTRLQTQAFEASADTSPLMGAERSESPSKRAGALQLAREAHREGGVRVFFKGLTVCSIRAFIVNAVQWAVYEWAMYEFGEGRRRPVDAGQSL